MRHETDVILITYRQAPFLNEALASIVKQTHQDFHILAVDDGSNDGSLEILENFAAQNPGKISIYTHPGCANRGAAESYRLALSKSRAPFVAFLEGDDCWEIRNLEKKVEVLKKNHGAGVVFSAYHPFGEKLPALYWRLHQAINRFNLPANRVFDNSAALLYRNNVSSFSHFVTRRELLKGMVFPCEDRRLDWWVLAHLSRKSGFYFVPEPLCRWRIHSGSASRRKWNKKELVLYRKFLAELHGALGKTETAKRGARLLFHELRFSAHRFLKNLLAA